MEQTHQEMQLLSSYPPPWPARFRPAAEAPFRSSPLDLGLSISLTPFKPPSDRVGSYSINGVKAEAEALKWEAAEQIRLAAMEKAYAEHMMEMTRREMEMAQSEFMRARSLWERAREEVDRAEKMREKACMERENITCLSCCQNFRP